MAENLNESPISWVPNLLPLCQIRGPTEEREDKWLLRCNGTQIICCESSNGVWVCAWSHDVCKFVCVSLSSVKMWTVSTGLCWCSRYACVCLYCAWLCSYLLLKVALRALHDWALRWLPAGLLDKLVSIVLSCNTQTHTQTPSLGHSKVAAVCVCVCVWVSVGRQTFELVSVWVTACPLSLHKLLAQSGQSRSSQKEANTVTHRFAVLSNSVR